MSVPILCWVNNDSLKRSKLPFDPVGTWQLFPEEHRS